MIEKFVKLFSVRLDKLQRTVGEMKEIVDTMLIDNSVDDFSKLPEYKQEAIRMILDALELQIRTYKLLHGIKD